MAGKLTISTLNNDTGVLATQNGMTGICKAWVNYNVSSGSSAVIRASFNVSSVTYNQTGVSTVNFTTAMPDSNYAVSINSRPIGDVGYTISHICPTALASPIYSTAGITVRTAWANSAQNPDIVTVAVFSS